MTEKGKTETGEAKKVWGFDVSIPGTLDDDAKAAALNETASKLLPHFVEVIAKAHGIDANGITAGIKR